MGVVHRCVRVCVCVCRVSQGQCVGFQFSQWFLSSRGLDAFLKFIMLSRWVVWEGHWRFTQGVKALGTSQFVSEAPKGHL